ncbi:hypothetical protein EBZ80_20975 [bacterium]|nr:hypothetical protein [bacterium]
MADVGEAVDTVVERAEAIRAAIKASNSRYRAIKREVLEKRINPVRKYRGQRLLTLDEFIAMDSKPVASSAAPKLNLYNAARIEAARESERLAMDKAAMRRVDANAHAAAARASAKIAADALAPAIASAEKASAAAKKAAEIAASAATDSLLTPEIEEAVKVASDAASKAAAAAGVVARAAVAAEKKAEEATSSAAAENLEATASAAAIAESAASSAVRRESEAAAAAAAAQEAVAQATASISNERRKMKEATAAKHDPAKLERYRALIEEFKGEFMKDKTTKAKATMIDNALKAGMMPPLTLFTKKQKERIRAANLANVAGLNAAATGGARRRRTQRRRRQQ